MLGLALRKLRRGLILRKHTCGPATQQPAQPATAYEQKQSVESAGGDSIGSEPEPEQEQEGQGLEEQEGQASDEHCDDWRLGGLCCDLAHELFIKQVWGPLL